MTNDSQNPRIDEFCRELALMLRRITGRDIKPDLHEKMPAPIQNPQTTKKEKDHDAK